MSRSDWVYISEGTFIMGESISNDLAEPKQTPQRKVWLSSYYIQRSPVSVGQWRWFLKETGYAWQFQDELDRYCSAADCPVVFVSWFDAQAFIQYQSVATGCVYSLPSEAQWEKACRGVNGQRYPWGDEPISPAQSETAWHLKHRERIGLFPGHPSVFGCLDMGGNIFEWCNDWNDVDYYTYMDAINPCGPEWGTSKTLRGGCYPMVDIPWCSSRSELKPSSRCHYVGFRLVLLSEPDLLP
jgi:formylglycine-generating enzyme required for sulfatase activity